MTRIVVDVERRAASQRSREQIWNRIGTVPDVALAIPAVRSCEPNGERWRWELSTYGALGLEVTPAFDVEATFREPEEVLFRPVGEVSEDARGRGRILLRERGAGTAVQASVHVEVDVPIGVLLAPALRRVMAHEIGKVLDGLIAELV